MSFLRIQKHKDGYDLNAYTSKNSDSIYNNHIDKDYRKIAQILIDLHLEGFPIKEAIVLFEEKMNKRDWVGFN